MKIIELEHRGPPSIGGVEKHVYEISKEFQRRGHTVEIWSSDILNSKGVRDNQRVKIVDGIKVTKFHSFRMPIRFPFVGSSIMPKMILKFLIINKRNKIIHAHSFSSLNSILALLFHLKFRTVIVTPHYDKGDFTKGDAPAFGILKFFVNNKKNIYLTAVSNTEKVFYVTCLGFNSEKIKVIPNGVDLNEFDQITMNDIITIKSKFSLEDKFIVLFVGRIAKIKGIHLLIKAVNLLNIDDLRLVIAGPDFSALDSLKNLSAKIGVAEKVIFTGELNRKDLCTLLRICDIFVLPSLGGEAFGIVLTEAMACRKPVVGSKTGGIPEVIEDGKSGYLFDVGSEEQLKNKLRYLYENLELRKIMGSYSRKKVEQNYTWKKSAEDYLRILSES